MILTCFLYPTTARLDGLGIVAETPQCSEELQQEPGMPQAGNPQNKKSTATTQKSAGLCHLYIENQVVSTGSTTEEWAQPPGTKLNHWRLSSTTLQYFTAMPEFFRFLQGLFLFQVPGLIR